MAAFTEFRPFVLPEVPGCPDVLVDSVIRDACRALSLDTWLIRSDLAAFNTVANTQSYTLIPATGTEILGVSTVVLDAEGPALSPISEATPLRYVQTTGTPSGYWYTGGKLWLYPTPDKVFSVAVEVIVRPTQAATTVDAKYLEYRDAVAAWSKWMLLSMVGKPWSEPNAAASNFSLYRSLTGVQRVRDNTGRTSSGLKVKNNFF